MDFIKFNKSLFDLNFKSKNEILQFNNKNIRIAFNMNGCFGNIKEIIYGIGNQKLTEFLYTNHFEVYCFETDKECISYFESLKNDGVDINIHIGSEEILVEKGITQFSSKTGKQIKDKIEKVLNPLLEEFFNMPKIDLTIMNPPYIRGKKEPLYLEIIKLLIDHLDENTKIISINPANYFQDIMLYNKGSYAVQLNYCVSKLIDCDIIKDTDATKFFKNAIFAYDLMIGTFKKNCVPMDINSLQINSKYDNIREKITNKLIPNDFIKGTIFNVGTKVPSTKHFIKITYKHGNPGKKDMFDILATENNKENLFIKSNKLNNSRCYLSYQTKEDRDAAYNLFNTSITLKFINKIFRTGAQIAYKYIPVMINNKITEKELCDYFGITGYIDNYHAEPGSDWEIILNTMKEFNINIEEIKNVESKSKVRKSKPVIQRKMNNKLKILKNVPTKEQIKKLQIKGLNLVTQIKKKNVAKFGRAYGVEWRKINKKFSDNQALRSYYYAKARIAVAKKFI